MKKMALAAVAILGTLAPLSADAAQGLFGGRSNQDGSINMRASTTEQFEPIRGQSVAARPRPDLSLIHI